MRNQGTAFISYNRFGSYVPSRDVSYLKMWLKSPLGHNEVNRQFDNIPTTPLFAPLGLGMRYETSTGGNLFVWKVDRRPRPRPTKKGPPPPRIWPNIVSVQRMIKHYTRTIGERTTSAIGLCMQTTRAPILHITRHQSKENANRCKGQVHMSHAK